MSSTRTRKHMLFVPGNNAAMFRDVISYKPDTVMFDFEDAIDLKNKDAARILTYHMLKAINYRDYGIETCIRINSAETPFFDNDIQAAVLGNVDMIRLPKVETVDDVKQAIDVIEKYEKIAKREAPVKLFIAIESALGVLNSYQIAICSDRIEGIALGGFDYLLDLKATKMPEPERKELEFARNMLLHAARAAKINAFDCVYSNVNDDAGMEASFRYVKSLGFDGKSCVHPRQLKVINKVCTPNEKEMTEALKIYTEYKKFSKSGQGVFAIDGHMIDKPIIQQAEDTIKTAIEFGLLQGDVLNG